MTEPQESDVRVSVAGVIEHVFRADGRVAVALVASGHLRSHQWSPLSGQDFADFQHLPGLPKLGEPLFKRKRAEDCKAGRR